MGAHTPGLIRWMRQLTNLADSITLDKNVEEISNLRFFFSG
jgi:hypothetical protein